MKNILKIAVFSLLLAAAGSCNDDKQSVDTSLPVTSNNISGTWQLERWNDAPLAGDSYVYLRIIRKDNLFELYQNLDSFQARLLTGRFELYDDEALGSLIRGLYDYGTGEWQHRYIVRDLTADRMVWVALDDPDDISIYVRCDAIPQEIIDQSRP